MHDHFSSFKHTLLVKVSVSWFWAVYMGKRLHRGEPYKLFSKECTAGAPFFLQYLFWASLSSSVLSSVSQLCGKFCIGLAALMVEVREFFCRAAATNANRYLLLQPPLILDASCEIIVAKSRKKQNKKRVAKVRTLSPGNPPRLKI